MRISDWSSDVCSSDLHARGGEPERPFVGAVRAEQPFGDQVGGGLEARGDRGGAERRQRRGEQRFGVGAVPRAVAEAARIVERLARKIAAVVVERKSVVLGQSVSVRVDLGGRRIIKKKTQQELAYRSATPQKNK